MSVGCDLIERLGDNRTGLWVCGSLESMMQNNDLMIWAAYGTNGSCHIS